MDIFKETRIIDIISICYKFQ